MEKKMRVGDHPRCPDLRIEQYKYKASWKIVSTVFSRERAPGSKEKPPLAPALCID
jgi:hypothetical protein